MKIVCILLTTLFFRGFAAQAQTGYQPTAANLQTRTWFDSARFGMFIHWGPSSVLGAGEWVMNNRNIKGTDYSRLQAFFNPQAFNAQKWVATAKAAGMQYITFITRHHDGFSLWDTKAADWNIMYTPYGKDILKQLSEACGQQGLKLFLYYSLLDWYRSDYPYETGRTGQGTGRTEKSNWPTYFAFMKKQLTELLTGYGPISGIWFDGHWDQLENDHDKKSTSKIDWQYEELYALIHRLQPGCMVGNNHHLDILPGEDFQMFEKDLPGGNTTGFGGAPVSNAVPLETCETINGSWGFNITDRNYKSTRELIHTLVKAAGYGSNFLLNIGPMPDGNIQPEFRERLTAIGTWLKTNGKTIYGTNGGYLSPQPWGAITQTGKKYYLHILDRNSEQILLPVPFKIKQLKTYKDGQPVRFTIVPDGQVVIHLNGVARDPDDTILVMEKE